MSENTNTSERLERSIEIDEKIDEIVNGVYPLLGAEGSTKYKIRVECRNQLVKALDELLRLANDAEEAGRDKSDLMRLVKCTDNIRSLLNAYDPSYKELKTIQNWVEEQYIKSHERSMAPEKHRNQ